MDNQTQELDYRKIGFRIGEKRRELGMTQEELANKIGKTYKHISAIENGRSRPNIDTFVKICTALGVTADYFLLGIFRDRQDENLKELIGLCPEKYIPVVTDILESLIKRG